MRDAAQNGASRPFVGVWADVVRRQGALGLSQVAAGVAFWLVIAVFPAGLAVVNIVGLFLDQADVATFVGRFAEATPGSLGDILAEQLNSVAESTPGTLLPDAILVVIAIWTVSTGMHHLVRGIQRAYGEEERRPLVVRAIAIVLALGAILALALLAWILDATTLLRSLAGYVASGVALSVLIAGVYWAAVGRRNGFRAALPGALVAAISLLLLGLGLETYAALAGNLRLIYGAVAGFVISMLGVWLAVYAVLIGAVLNARLAPVPGSAVKP